MIEEVDYSYHGALEVAGATVHEYKEFGSYQGDWFAVVTWKGNTGIVAGSYGSCSGCDALEAEFCCDYHEDPENNNDYHSALSDFHPSCSKCQETLAKFIEFGTGYLEGLTTFDEAFTQSQQNAEWDMEAKEIGTWIQEMKQKYDPDDHVIVGLS